MFITFRDNMPSKHYLNNEEKEEALQLSMSGENIFQISKILKRHHVTLKRFLSSPMQYGKKIKNAGRKKIVSNRMKRIIKRSFGEKKISTRTVAKQLSEQISHVTVWRTIRESKLKYMKMMKAPTLTCKHKSERLNFARETLLNGQPYWSKICFSDEKRFCLDGPDCSQKYWHDIRKDNLIFDQNTFSRGVMVWGAIFSDGRRCITFVDGTIDSNKYQNILEQNLVPLWEPTDDIFQQDNATPHKAKKTCEFLINNNITSIQWPSKSPDLNIIENIWGILTSRIYAENVNYESISCLKKAIQRHWQDISKDTILNLFKSIPNRLLNVVERKGGFLCK